MLRFFRVCDNKEFSDKNWLKGAFREVDTSKFDESLLRGEAMVGQAPSIYGSHRREMARGLRMHGSLDSLVRTLVIHMNGAAAGRPGEIATMSTDVMAWDPLVNGLTASWPQIKTRKLKLALFPAGFDRLICVLNALACAFAAGCFKTQMWKDESLNYLFPSRPRSSAVGSKR